MTSKQWGILGGVAAAGWLALYIYFWLDRTGCGQTFTHACNEAPIKGLGDVVMFQWAWQHPEIASAWATMIGASAVLLGLWYNSRQQFELRRSLLLAGIAECRIHLIKCQMTLMGTSNFVDVESDIDRLQAAIVKVSAQMPELAEWLQLGATDVLDSLPRTHWETWDGIDHGRWRRAYASVIAMLTYIDNPTRLFDERLRYTGATADRQKFRTTMGDIEFEIDDLVWAGPLFR